MKTRIIFTALGFLAVACLFDFIRHGDILMHTSASGGMFVVALLVFIGIGIISLARSFAALVRWAVGSNRQPPNPQQS